MSFLEYLHDRAIFLAGLGVIELFLLGGLYAFSSPWAQIVFFCAVVLLVATCVLIYDYLRRRRFYQVLKSRLDQFSRRYLVVELLDRPDFLEGELFFDALQAATKDMNDVIASYRISQEDYRDYIEMWVHEVKTPIAASRLIVENRPDMTDGDLITQLDRIEDFLEQALYYSRSTAVEKDYAIKSIALDAAVKNAVRKHSRLLIESHIVPEFKDLECEIYMDTKWLDFILGQIIANAARYAGSSDGKESRLYFTGVQLDDGLDTRRVILRIRDCGVGISSQDLPRVFEKGFTGQNGRSFSKTTGMGLYLCKRLCEKMGLHISVDSALGEGTEVSITFPQNKMYFAD